MEENVSDLHSRRGEALRKDREAMVVQQKRNEKEGILTTDQNVFMDIRTDKFYCWMIGFKADAHSLPLIHLKPLLQMYSSLVLILISLYDFFAVGYKTLEASSLWTHSSVQHVFLCEGS